MKSFVVVLEHSASGITDFPNVPNAAGLRGLMFSQIAHTAGKVESPTGYLTRSGAVIGFSINLSEAKRFPTRAAAQAAIDSIPPLVRPGGLSIKAIDQ